MGTWRKRWSKSRKKRMLSKKALMSTCTGFSSRLTYWLSLTALFPWTVFTTKLAVAARAGITAEEAEEATSGTRIKEVAEGMEEQRRRDLQCRVSKRELWFHRAQHCDYLSLLCSNFRSHLRFDALDSGCFQVHQRLHLWNLR